MYFPLMCFGIFFAISMMDLEDHLLTTGDWDDKITFAALVSLVALNAALAFALPFGYGLIRRRQWAIRGTKVTAALTLCLSSSIFILGFFRSGFSQDSLSVVLFVGIPSAVYVSSSFYLWFLTRRWF
jgi:hypothetical protein